MDTTASHHSTPPAWPSVRAYPSMPVSGVRTASDSEQRDPNETQAVGSSVHSHSQKHERDDELLTVDGRPQPSKKAERSTRRRIERQSFQETFFPQPTFRQDPPSISRARSLHASNLLAHQHLSQPKWYYGHPNQMIPVMAATRESHPINYRSTPQVLPITHLTPPVIPPHAMSLPKLQDHSDRNPPASISPAAPLPPTHSFPVHVQMIPVGPIHLSGLYSHPFPRYTLPAARHPPSHDDMPHPRYTRSRVHSISPNQAMVHPIHPTSFLYYHTLAHGPTPELLPPPPYSYTQALPSYFHSPEASQMLPLAAPPVQELEERQKKEWQARVLQLAHEKYNASDFASTLKLLQDLNAIYPHHLPTLLLLGCTAYSMGQLELSLSYNQSILHLDPKFAEAYSNLGTTYRALGDLEQAEVCYLEALRLKPKYWDALCNLAGVLSSSGRLEEALHVYERAERLDTEKLMHASLSSVGGGRVGGGSVPLNSHVPSPARRRDLFFAMANLKQLQGDVPGSRAYFIKALQAVGVYVNEEAGLVIQPLPCLIHHETTLAILHTLSKLFQEENAMHLSISCYYTSLRLLPTPNACNNLGILLTSLGLPERIEEAIQWYTYGLSLDGQHVHLYTNLGSALKDRGRVTEAIGCYQRALQIQPDFAIALANLGNAFKDIGNVEEAIDCYRKALTFQPDFVDAFCNYVHSLMFICDWKDRNKHFSRIRRILSDQLKQQEESRSMMSVPTILPFHTFTYPLSIGQVRTISVRNAQRIRRAVEVAGWLPNEGYPNPVFEEGQRFKVGYVSSDFGNHPLSHLMQSVFGLHDRSRFEIYAYALSANDLSEFRLRIEREAEHFVDCHAWSTQAIVERIVQDGILMLVNLNGYTKGARNDVFAARPSPLQMTYMGFAGTLGAKWIDYFIVDEVAAPQQIQEIDGGLYTEQLMYLPHSYFVNDHKQHFREGVVERTLADGTKLKYGEADIAETRRLYRSQLFPDLEDDIDPETYIAWLRILDAVPRSILWLLRFPALGERHLLEFASNHLAVYAPSIPIQELKQRIRFTDIAPKQEHIARGVAVDVFLDTPECNAHTTAADILWSGTPLITLPKIKFASRVAAGMCFTTGLGRQLVANSWEDYVQKAIRLAQNPEELQKVKLHLRETRETGRLFDTGRWVRNLERGLSMAWQRYREGLAPTTLRVEDPEDLPMDRDNLIVGSSRVQCSIPEHLDEMLERMTEPWSPEFVDSASEEVTTDPTSQSSSSTSIEGQELDETNVNDVLDCTKEEVKDF